MADGYMKPQMNLVSYHGSSGFSGVDWKGIGNAISGFANVIGAVAGAVNTAKGSGGNSGGSNNNNNNNNNNDKQNYKPITNDDGGGKNNQMLMIGGAAVGFGLLALLLLKK